MVRQAARETLFMHTGGGSRKDARLPDAPFRRRVPSAGAAALAAPFLVRAAQAQRPLGALPWQEGLTPVLVEEGVRFDLPGVAIGTAEYAEGPTGCNVFHFPEGAICEVDARGGSPYGLEVGTGVARELFAERRRSVVGAIGLVSGATIFDHVRRDTLVFPGQRLGAAAFRAARPGRFPVGARGAGSPASIGQIGSRRFRPEQGGQGCAVGKIGAATIGVFTVLNRLGGILDRQGQLLRGFMDRETGQRRPPEHIMRHHPEELGLVQGTAGSHTTITAVIIDRAVPAWDLRQLGRQIHAAMAQAIRPFHTPLDGGVLFALSTGREPLALPAALAAEVGSQLALDAVYSAIPG